VRSSARPSMAANVEAPGPGGKAACGQQPARVPLRQLMDDWLPNALLAWSRDEAGGLR